MTTPCTEPLGLITSSLGFEVQRIFRVRQVFGVRGLKRVFGGSGLTRGFGGFRG